MDPDGIRMGRKYFDGGGEADVQQHLERIGAASVDVKRKTTGETPWKVMVGDDFYFLQCFDQQFGFNII